MNLNKYCFILDELETPVDKERRKANFSFTETVQIDIKSESNEISNNLNWY